MSAAPLWLLAAALCGAALGALYMALLWLAVRRLGRAQGGVPAFVGLAVARAALILGALAAAAALGLSAAVILAALLGFVAMRLAATRLGGRKTGADRAWK